jgi:hypothetical protein
MTLASLAHVKPAGKRSLYKYNYNGFMQDCTKLATAVQNRPQVALIADGQLAATPITNRLMTNAQQILQFLPTETKFLVVEGKHIINNEVAGPVRSHNLCILVTCIGVGGQPIPECNQVLAQASIVNGWMNKSKKKYKYVILARDAFLPMPGSDAVGEPASVLTRHVYVLTNVKFETM